MNIHPLVVHFPIALLSLFALFEVVRFQKLLSKPYWFYIKAVLVIVGNVTAFAGLVTGSMAEKSVMKSQPLETHERFALITFFISALLAASYVARWCEQSGCVLQNNSAQKFWLTAVRINSFIQRGYVLVLLSLLLGLSISVTGALGASLVYGPDNDIFTRLINDLLF